MHCPIRFHFKLYCRALCVIRLAHRSIPRVSAYMTSQPQYVSEALLIPVNVLDPAGVKNLKTVSVGYPPYCPMARNSSRRIHNVDIASNIPQGEGSGPQRAVSYPCSAYNIIYVHHFPSASTP